VVLGEESVEGCRWVQQESSAGRIGGEQDSVTGHQQAAPLQPDGAAEVAVGADPDRSV
jgi:hypothetical protein